MSLRTVGIEKMISLALCNGLIIDYQLSPSTIRLVEPDNAVEFDPETARFYLSGLLEGYQRCIASVGPVHAALPRVA